MRLPTHRIVQVIVFVMVVSIQTRSAAAEQTTASIMHQVYDAIAYLLPLSLRDPTHSTVWDRSLIDDKLQTLKKASKTLKQHTAAQEWEFRHLARSFDELSGDLYKAFSNEWPEFAYFSMMGLVQHCVACHSRVAAPSSQLFGQRLMARMDLRELPPADVVKIHIATRQFDTALKSIETMLMDQNLHPIEADYGSLMVDHLHIAITAKRSPATAEGFLRRYLARGDVPFYLKRRIEFWLTALDEFSDDMAAEPSIEAAKAIFYAADALSRGPGNRVRAVHDITAASIIRRYLAVGTTRRAEVLGEAYYILGVIALRTLEPKSAVPEMELLLASSIKADPDGPHALESYALLEEYGYVHEDQLAAESTTQTLIDMSELSTLIGR